MKTVTTTPNMWLLYHVRGRRIIRIISDYIGCVSMRSHMHCRTPILGPTSEQCEVDDVLHRNVSGRAEGHDCMPGQYQCLRLAAVALLSSVVCLSVLPSSLGASIAVSMKDAGMHAVGAMPLPLYFEALHDQGDARKHRFVARSGDLRVLLTSDSAVFALPGGEGMRPVWRMRLVGSHPSSRLDGLDRRAGRSHHLVGDVPAAWRTQMLHYSRVQSHDVYPGVDLVYYGTRGHFAFDFVVEPGADPGRIQLAFERVIRTSPPLRLEMADDGNLIIRVGDDEMYLKKPHVYQDIGASQTVVPGEFVLHPPSGQDRSDGNDDVMIVAFRLGPYDRSQRLVIDPVLTYSTRVGGIAGLTRSRDIAIDSDGMVYVVGETFGDVFPVENPLEASSGGSVDAFVTKIDPRTDELVYSTRLGGRGIDRGFGIALDDARRVYVTGSTSSEDFSYREPAIPGYV